MNAIMHQSRYAHSNLIESNRIVPMGTFNVNFIEYKLIAAPLFAIVGETFLTFCFLLISIIINKFNSIQFNSNSIPFWYFWRFYRVLFDIVLVMKFYSMEMVQIWNFILCITDRKLILYFAIWFVYGLLLAELNECSLWAIPTYLLIVIFYFNYFTFILFHIYSLHNNIS